VDEVDAALSEAAVPYQRSFEIPYREPCTRVLRKMCYANTSTKHTMGEEQFPEVQGGGSLILAWQIRNKRVLVVGGGEASSNFKYSFIDCH
jgi:hypothetical protein